MLDEPRGRLRVTAPVESCELRRQCFGRGRIVRSKEAQDPRGFPAYSLFGPVRGDGSIESWGPSGLRVQGNRREEVQNRPRASVSAFTETNGS